MIRAIDAHDPALALEARDLVRTGDRDRNPPRHILEKREQRRKMRYDGMSKSTGTCAWLGSLDLHVWIGCSETFG